jgi:hypothetical protein
MGPSVECAGRCYDEVSLREWTAWLAAHEVVGVLGMALALLLFYRFAKRLVRKQWDDKR